MAGLACQEALTRYKYDARFTLKKEGEKNVLLGALKRSDGAEGRGAPHGQIPLAHLSRFISVGTHGS